MRKTRVLAGLVVVLLVGVVSSCSLSIFGGGGISPPSWIRGTWLDSSGTYGFEFTSNNIKQLMAGITTLDFSSEGYTAKEKTESNTVYAVDLTSPGGTSTFKFEKIDSDTIKATVGSVGGPVVPYYLYKVD